MGLSNVDQLAKDEYYNKVRMLKTQKDQINMINEEISNLRNDMNEIKQLLIQQSKKK